MEIWKPIPEWETLYEVSDEGRVKSTRRNTILVPKVQKGYASVSFAIGTYGQPGCVRKTEKVHRLVALAFCPNPANLPIVQHLDGDKANNRASNLSWATQKENVATSMVQGRMNAATNPNKEFKVKNSDLPAIRARIARGENQYEIAKMYGISQSTVSEIKRGFARYEGEVISTPEKLGLLEDEIRLALEAGETQNKIAARLGVSQAWASRVAVKYGIKSQSKFAKKALRNLA